MQSFVPGNRKIINNNLNQLFESALLTLTLITDPVNRFNMGVSLPLRTKFAVAKHEASQKTSRKLFNTWVLRAKNQK